MHTVTISHHLETPYDDHIPSAECLVRNQTEAATRHVVWDAEKLVEAVTDEDSKVVDVAPMGVRDQEGLVRGLAEVERLAEEEEEREGEGEGEEKWRDLRSMVGLVEDEERVIVLAKGEQVRPVQLEGEDDNAALRRAVSYLFTHLSHCFTLTPICRTSSPSSTLHHLRLKYHKLKTCPSCLASNPTVLPCLCSTSLPPHTPKGRLRWLRRVRSFRLSMRIKR